MILSGGFIQVWESMLSLSVAEWTNELRTMVSARIPLVVLQWSQANTFALFPQPDTLGALLTAADALQMQVLVGLHYDDGWPSHWSSDDYLAQQAQRNIALAGQLLNRYRNHPSFIGWYLPQEIPNLPFEPQQKDRFIRFIQTVGRSCRQLDLSKHVMLSPYFVPPEYPVPGMPPAESGQFWRQLVQGGGVTILALQDGVGARNWDANLEQVLPPYFDALRGACEAENTQAWANVEAFVRAGDDQRFPAPFDRIHRQIDTVEPYVKGAVTFDFYHYMSPLHNDAAANALYAFYKNYAVAQP